MLEHLDQKIEYFEYLGRHPAKAGEVARRQQITHGEIPRIELAKHYKNTAETIKTLDQGIKQNSQRRSVK